MAKSTVQERWKCPHCGKEGWHSPHSHTATKYPHPKNDHDRPDGRRCLKSRIPNAKATS